MALVHQIFASESLPVGRPGDEHPGGIDACSGCAGTTRPTADRPDAGGTNTSSAATKDDTPAMIKRPFPNLGLVLAATALSAAAQQATQRMLDMSVEVYGAIQ